MFLSQKGMDMKGLDFRAISLVALATASLWPASGVAQTASSSTEQVPQPSDQALDPAASEPQPPLEGATDTGDIVVTAQRRSERLV